MFIHRAREEEPPPPRLAPIATAFRQPSFYRAPMPDKWARSTSSEDVGFSRTRIATAKHDSVFERAHTKRPRISRVRIHQAGSTLPRSQPLRPPKNIKIHAENPNKGHRASFSHAKTLPQGMESDVQVGEALVSAAPSVRRESRVENMQVDSSHTKFQVGHVGNGRITIAGQDLSPTHLVSKITPVPAAPNTQLHPTRSKHFGSVYDQVGNNQKRTPARDDRPTTSGHTDLYHRRSAQMLVNRNYNGSRFQSNTGSVSSELSSLWSVNEQQVFEHPVERFGTNWTSIAEQMNTKTPTIIENPYQQLVGLGRKDPEPAVTRAGEGIVELSPAPSVASSSPASTINTGIPIFQPEDGEKRSKSWRQQLRSMMQKGVPTKHSNTLTWSLAGEFESEPGVSRASRKRFQYTVSQDLTAEETQHCKSQFTALRQGHRSVFSFVDDNASNPDIEEGKFVRDKQKRRAYYD
ncbi:hypothetical protein FB567DRAFT_6188 [Paraphoma chrysanthemicola]|uniref:Myb-like domain-containing protein n=1 Tax=Paraphoma chrysanthemicola TaxID=798071 RepID=A0A8K0W3R8_9PLEO|nr:hypothetical protein FB567DRAFT_6188 [Paraphoma chrysanthemicola]